MMLSMLCAGALSMARGLPEEVLWLTSYEKAVAAAKEENRLILADFTGSDWCGWCIKLKEEVFDTPEFKKWAGKNVVLLEVDFPRGKEQSDELKKQNQELQAKFSIQGYPTILFLDLKGEKIGRLGYQKGGPKPWIDAARKITRKS